MQSPELLCLTLIPSSDDPSTRGVAYQSELRRLGEFLQAQHAEISSGVELLEADGACPVLTGEFFVRLTDTIVPILVAVAGVTGAWLQARYGRRVRLKVGDIEAEAQTREEVEALLKIADRIQQQNQTKCFIVHEG